MDIFTNTNKRNDIFKNAINKYAQNTDVYIAVPFFSNSDFVKEAIDNGCTSVQLIVRLCQATSAERLKDIFNYKNKVHIRFFTDEKFHPKLYIFGNEIAFVGSSNLTKSGVTTNREINVSISDEESIIKLQCVFNEYWEDAEVLNDDKLNKFIEVDESFSKALNNNNKEYSNEIKTKIGEYNSTTDIVINKKKKSEETVFISNFRRSYQLFISKYIDLEKYYTEITSNYRRKELSLPIQIEIDQFLSWLRDEYIKGDSYIKVTEKKDSEIKNIISSHLDGFLKSTVYIKDKYIEDYGFLKEALSSKESIEKIEESDFKRCLLFINAFKSRTRFYGGDEGAVQIFFTDNSFDKIKETIIYLLYGKEIYEDRIASCIYNENISLKHFGSSCIKELFGLINDKNIPPCNDRTLKVMQWLGFGKLL